MRRMNLGNSHQRGIQIMHIETALLVGVLFAAATYLILHRSFVKILFGFVVLSNAANLLVLAMSGSPEGQWALSFWMRILRWWILCRRH